MRQRTIKSGFEGKRMLSAAEAGVYCGLGRNQTRIFAEQAGAVRRFGRRVLFDRDALDRALDALDQTEAKD